MPSRHPAAVTATIAPLTVLLLVALLLAAGALGGGLTRPAGSDLRKDTLHVVR
jgi:hypothetical protein